MKKLSLIIVVMLAVALTLPFTLHVNATEIIIKFCCFECKEEITMCTCEHLENNPPVEDDCVSVEEEEFVFIEEENTLLDRFGLECYKSTLMDMIKVLLNKQKYPVFEDHGPADMTSNWVEVLTTNHYGNISVHLNCLFEELKQIKLDTANGNYYENVFMNRSFYVYTTDFNSKECSILLNYLYEELNHVEHDINTGNYSKVFESIEINNNVSISDSNTPVFHNEDPHHNNTVELVQCPVDRIVDFPVEDAFSLVDCITFGANNSCVEHIDIINKYTNATYK